METIQHVLETRFQAAITAAFGADYASVDPQVKPSANPKFGDFQANFAMSLAGRMGKKPRDVAQDVLSRTMLDGIAKATEIAGPGFINVHLSEDFLKTQLVELAADARCGVAPLSGSETVVIDYSAPNVAKEMHVGHIRSTIIGDAIARLLEFLGHRLVRQNHLGDWGTQFGMLIEHIIDLGWDSGGDHSISDLDQLYKGAKAKFDGDAAFAERARLRVVALQAGDPLTLKLWHILIDESKHHFHELYQRLGVTLTEGDYKGESFYNPLLDPTVEDLLKAGRASVSNGAVCLFPEGFLGPEGTPVPLILRKSDGGYGYDSTDMAAIRYRVNELKANRLIYVTDARQKQHFAMIFKAAAEAGWLPATVKAEHVYFGAILGEDGKPFKSRSGDTVKLSEVLAEAAKRAYDLVSAKNPDFPEEERRLIAETVGIGAVKYADLSNDRIKDYSFVWDRMLAFDGNTAPYLQNAYVRIRSIFRKAAEAGVKQAPGAQPGLAEPAERALALQLMLFSDAVYSVSRSLEPHRLCTYLYELATAYHQFYEHCPVLTAPDAATRDGRLALCELTARTLRQGLGLLGIGVVDRM